MPAHCVIGLRKAGFLLYPVELTVTSV